MRIQVKLVSIAALLTLGACGVSNNQDEDQAQGPITPTQAQQNEPVTVTAEEGQELNEAVSLPQGVIQRVPMVNGQPDFSQAEVIAIDKSIDFSNPKAVAQAFEGAQTAQRIQAQVVSEEELNTSLQQYHSRFGNRGVNPWPRRGWYLLPWRRRVANAIYDLANGRGYQRQGCGHHRPCYQPYYRYNQYYHSYSYSGACQYQSYSYYGYQQSNWYRSSAGYWF